MPFLLDTATISEYRRVRPNTGLIAWTQAHAFEETYLGTPTLGEFIQGVHTLAPSQQRDHLQRWVAEIERRFEGHIVPFDAEVARVWGEVNGRARRRGRKLPVIDSQLAAIAVVHDLTVVTRNLRDFDIPEFESLKVVSPWT